MAKFKFQLKPDTIESIGELLIKIIGDTVPDKIIRAILIACIAGGTALMTNEPPEAPRVPFSQTLHATK